MKTGLQVANLGKSFNGVQVLADVNIDFELGSVHAVTGENGAGKSTLMKTLAGVYRPDTGSIRVDGKTVFFHSPQNALSVGISTVFQEFTLLPNLTVAENLFLGRETMAGISLDRKAMNSAASDTLFKVGLSNVSPESPVRDLNLSEQQLVEIAKGISADADVFIFDEPTAALGKEEVHRLKNIIRNLKAQRKTVIYVSHHLDEVFELCDKVTVLKDGRLVTTQQIGSLNKERLISLMVGRSLHEMFPPRGMVKNAVVLDVRVDLGAGPLAIKVLEGEILGIAGLEGQGQRPLARALGGVSTVNGMSVSLYGQRLEAFNGVHQAIEHGIAFVPEDRKQEGLCLGLSVAENISLGKYVGFRLWNIAQPTDSLVKKIVLDLAVRPTDPKAVTRSLSGGNQQKVLLGRWLGAGVKVLVIEQPTRGVDVGAKAEIYLVLREFTNSGGSVVVVSNDTPELIGLSNRILVMARGRITAEMPAEQATEENITHAAFALH